MLLNEIPGIEIHAGACSDALGGVYRAAAADSKQDLDVVLLAHCDRFADVADLGVGLNSALLEYSYALLIEVAHDPVIQTGPLYAASAVGHQASLAVARHDLAELLELFRSEINRDRVAPSEVGHDKSPFAVLSSK